MDFDRRVDSLFSCLGHPFRRETIVVVAETDGTIATTELADEIASRSDPVGAGVRGADPVEAIRTELHHSHLPKLAAADLVEYDPDANLVSSTTVTTHLTALVQIAHSIADVM